MLRDRRLGSASAWKTLFSATAAVQVDNQGAKQLVVFNTHEAKTYLSRILARVEAGEEVVIAKAGKPIARLVPMSAAPTPRLPDAYAGKIVVHQGFDEELPDDLLDAFAGPTD